MESWAMDRHDKPWRGFVAELGNWFCHFYVAEK